MKRFMLFGLFFCLLAVAGAAAQPRLTAPSRPPPPRRVLPGVQVMAIRERVLDLFVTERVEEFRGRIHRTVAFWTPQGVVRERLTDDYAQEGQESLRVDAINCTVAIYDRKRRRVHVRFFHNPRVVTLPYPQGVTSLLATPDGSLLVRATENAETPWTFYPEKGPPVTAHLHSRMREVFESALTDQGYLAGLLRLPKTGSKHEWLLLMFGPDGKERWRASLTGILHRLWPAPDGRGVLLDSVVNLKEGGKEVGVHRLVYCRAGDEAQELMALRHGNIEVLAWVPDSSQAILQMGYPQYELLALDCGTGKVAWSRKHTSERPFPAAPVPAQAWGGAFPLVFFALPSQSPDYPSDGKFLCLRGDTGQELGSWPATFYRDPWYAWYGWVYGHFHREQGRLWFVSAYAVEEIDVKAAARGEPRFDDSGVAPGRLGPPPQPRWARRRRARRPRPADAHASAGRA